MVTTTQSASSKRARTQARLQEVALALFERQGYDATTVEQIARAAGVSHMTFFRAFPSKESVLLDDPFDPAIAAAVAAQPMALPPLPRVCAGLRAALAGLELPEQDQIRRRVRVAAGVPSLQAGIWANTAETQRVIGQVLLADGVDPVAARAAAAAAIGALTATLLGWSLDEADDSPLGLQLLAALDAIDPPVGRPDGVRA